MAAAEAEAIVWTVAAPPTILRRLRFAVTGVEAGAGTGVGAAVPAADPTTRSARSDGAVESA